VLSLLCEPSSAYYSNAGPPTLLFSNWPIINCQRSYRINRHLVCHPERSEESLAGDSSLCSIWQYGIWCFPA